MYTTIGAQPKPADIRAWIFDGSSGERIRCLLLTGTDDRTRVEIPMDRAVLDALQAALDAIRLDMGKAEQAAMAAKRAARADEIRAEMAQTASDQVPTVMADWPAGPPGELAEVFGK